MVASAKLPEASSSKPIFTGSAALAVNEVTASPAMRARRIQADGFSNMRNLQKWALGQRESQGERSTGNTDKKKPPDEPGSSGGFCAGSPHGHHCRAMGDGWSLRRRIFACQLRSKIGATTVGFLSVASRRYFITFTAASRPP